MARLERLVVLVEWHDAHATSEWTDPSAIDEEPFVVNTVGYLIENGKPNHVVVAQSEGAEGDLDGILSIPTGMVVKIVTLGHPPQANIGSL